MRSIQEQFAARMLRVADELFQDHPGLPMMIVIDALNETRRALRGPEGEEPAAAQLVALTRERLKQVSQEPAAVQARAS
jgi:hypothetical protein